MPQRGGHWQRGTYLFRRVAGCFRPMYTYGSVLENARAMGSHTNQLDSDEHEVTNVLNRRHCLMRPDGQYCYGDPVVILLLLPVQPTHPHFAPLT